MRSETLETIRAVVNFQPGDLLEYRGGEAQAAESFVHPSTAA
jgi:DNA-binding Xre family transcriptional regulator